ncbi:MAG: uracil-DNA glycosylase family protein [Gammaproteobacteria bacterium]
MNEDFLTRERIERLQVMGITVWQERGKRAQPNNRVADPVDEQAATGAVSPKAATESAKPNPVRTGSVRAGPKGPGPRSSQPSASIVPPVTVHEAPKPDASDLDWQQLRAAVANCRACGLCESRTQTVFGTGNESAQVMIIGEAPGVDEDRQGEPFAGTTGQLLDAMLSAIGLGRSEVFITNVLKCKPPANRDPHASEASQCSSYLQRQIDLVDPGVLIAVGRVASQLLLNSTASLGRLRGKVHSYGEHQIPCVVTYHPAYLLRSPEQKRKAWEDLLKSQALLESKT